MVSFDRTSSCVVGKAHKQVFVLNWSEGEWETWYWTLNDHMLRCLGEGISVWINLDLLLIVISVATRNCALFAVFNLVRLIWPKRQSHSRVSRDLANGV